MADKISQYTAEWSPNLKVNGDPNRVCGAHALAPRAPASLAPPAEYPPLDLNPDGSAGYYDIPMLKAPLWRWEIAGYFFLGGISAGAYLLARAAERFGGEEFAGVAKLGAKVSLLALLPCPALLIHDLGDPRRFHHMLRVWKPSSPMNLGTWTLLAYSGMVSYEVLRGFLDERREGLNAVDAETRTGLSKLVNNGALLLIHDAAGVPLALLVASYTGVLLSCTAKPLWCKNPWLAPLFTASAVSTGAEALSLALDLKDATPAAQTALQRIDSAAHAVEGVALRGFMQHAGEKAATLRDGKYATLKKCAALGIVAAEVLKALPVRERHKKPMRMLAAALGLASGFALRWAMVYGGHAAANDPRTARMAGNGKLAGSKGAKSRHKGGSRAGRKQEFRRAHVEGPQEVIAGS